ncbi:MAG: proline dehydrogenase family protein [Actinomycetota bacterium]
MTLFDQAIARVLPAVPKPVVQRFSQRYIAGSHLTDAIAVVERLNAEGKLATIDVLGEEIRSEDAARAIARAYTDVFEAIEDDGLGANVSIKPTALGLDLSYDLCKENVESIVAQGKFVRIDMEDSSTTDETLRLYRELREAGHDNVGVVLQARLRRTLDDIGALADLQPNIRLCKGIYLEPPSIAYTDYEAIRANYVKALRALAAVDGAHVAIATHDEWLLEQALAQLPPSYELQMLLGVREERASELVRAGHRVRIYVPFGEQWYQYSLRRLQENPAMAGTIARSTISRLLGR